MNQDDRTGRRSPDAKSGGQSVLLYVAAAAVGVSLLVMLLVKNSATVISYQHLLQLIDQSAKSPDGAIEIQQRQSSGEQSWKLSNLRDVKIGDRVVRGLIDIERLGEPASKTNPRRGVTFQVFRSTSDAVEAELIAKLQASKLEWANDPEPSPWRAYMPMLLFTGVLILFFVFMMRRLGGAGSPMQFGAVVDASTRWKTWV